MPSRRPTGRPRCAASSAASSAFELENLGREPVFSDFRVHNPASGTPLPRRHPRPALGAQPLHLPRLRDQRPGHLQAHRVHAGQAAARRGGKAALRAGFEPAYSEIWLDYAGQRAGAPSRRQALPAGVLAHAKADVRCGCRLGAALGPPRRVCTPAAAGRARRRPRTALRRRRLGFRRPGPRRRAPPGHAGRGLPQGRARQGAGQAAEGQALPLPGRRRAVRRARRPRADRRRDGPGQDHAGHRGGRAVGAPLRRAARAGRLPHLAEAPVEERVRTFHRARGAGHPRAARAARKAVRAKTPSARSPTTRRWRAMPT